MSESEPRCFTKGVRSVNGNSSIYDLPHPLLVEILQRMRDSAAVARCRLVSKAFNSASCDLRSIYLTCSHSQYVTSRSRNPPGIVPFKENFMKLIRSSAPGSVEIVEIGMEKSMSVMTYDDIDDSESDLHLTDAIFVAEWLPMVCDQLRKLSVSDFWMQSCWRRSSVLGMISISCKHLIELKLKNAWLSVEDLEAMPTLTTLTLEFIRLDDEDLSKVNKSFPSLRVLNLIGVGGLRDPKIHLQYLQTCRWIVSNAPLSLTICSSSLQKLELHCVRPRFLTLEVPLLSDLYLSLEKADCLELGEIAALTSLYIKSTDISPLIALFPHSTNIVRLTVDFSKFSEDDNMKMVPLESLINSFPLLSSLTLKNGNCFSSVHLGSQQCFKYLKELNIYLVIHALDVTLPFIFSLVAKCPNLLNVRFILPGEYCVSNVRELILSCTAKYPRIRWSWEACT